MHRTYLWTIGIQQGLINTRLDLYGEILTVDDRVHSGVIEVLVVYIELLLCCLAQRGVQRSFWDDTAQEIASDKGLFDTLLRGRTVSAALYRTISNEWPLTLASDNGCAEYKSFRFYNP